MRRWLVLSVGLLAASLTSVPTPADACGCLSPPVPTPGAVDEQGFAVNQQSEQIIFEVPGDGTVTAHVLIRYAGEPESFAWIVPVPSAPEHALSESTAFALLEPGTAPGGPPAPTNLCPGPAFECRSHPPLYCGGGGGGGFGCGFAEAGAVPAGFDAGGGFASDGSAPPAGPMPPVDVIGREVIGSYETITFGASDTAAAVGWLQDEGFIVNETMAPYMQPYADAGMLFVASRLVPGAGVDEIRPLRMTFLADQPMIPLMLTAVAAEPHLTVTAYIYGSEYFAAVDHPEIDVPDEDVVRVDGRSNYPMAMARLIDEAGGDAFVAEYRGGPYVPSFGDDTGCCGGSDWCNIGFDGLCQCPRSAFDARDCQDLSIGAGIDLLEDLASRYTHLTRITTRLSAEEMTFDPMFEGRADLTEVRPTQRYGGFALAGCEDAVVDADRATASQALAVSACATTYCGEGECVTTSLGAACLCDRGFVARTFSDLDGLPSVTCVPDVAPVDYAAGGIELPDACLGVDCGAGTCLDVGGFPTCDCDALNAAGVGGGAPACRPVIARTRARGGADFTGPLGDISVCAPAAPASCGVDGWLVELPGRPDHVQICAAPAESRFVVPPRPTCDDDEGGCSITPLGALVFRRGSKKRREG